MTRLMCSEKMADVELVKKELFKAGIPAEIRSNPLADALRITRVELWVQHERDYFDAQKLYAALQDRGNGHPRAAGVSRPARETCVEVSAPMDPPAAQPGDNAEAPDGEDLAEAGSLLEKEIEALLQREDELERTGASLRAQVKDLGEQLARARADLKREKETRAAAEKSRLTELAGLQAALERERGDRARAQEQLEREARESERKLQEREDTLREALKQIHAHAATLNSLRGKLHAKRSAAPGS